MFCVFFDAVLFWCTWVVITFLVKQEAWKKYKRMLKRVCEKRGPQDVVLKKKFKRNPRAGLVTADLGRVTLNLRDLPGLRDTPLCLKARRWICLGRRISFLFHHFWFSTNISDVFMGPPPANSEARCNIEVCVGRQKSMFPVSAARIPNVLLIVFSNSKTFKTRYFINMQKVTPENDSEPSTEFSLNVNNRTVSSTKQDMECFVLFFRQVVLP